MAIKNPRKQETATPSPEVVGETDQKRREKAADALRRNIGRIASNIRAGGGGADEGGNDI